jgi:hypothetical protein
VCHGTASGWDVNPYVRICTDINSWNAHYCGDIGHANGAKDVGNRYDKQPGDEVVYNGKTYTIDEDCNVQEIGAPTAAPTRAADELSEGDKTTVRNMLVDGFFFCCGVSSLTFYFRTPLLPKAILISKRTLVRCLTTMVNVIWSF